MPHRKPRYLSALLLAATLALSACSAPSLPAMSGGARAGGIGVNVGGAQDIKLVRELIDNGQVPRETQFTAQGLYAEHDLPVAEAPAGKPLHLALGLGIAPALPEGARTHWVQVGLGSGLTAAEFKRPPQHLVVVADRSGSMADKPIAALRVALNELVDKLNEQDSLGIVLFDDKVDVLHELGAVTNKAAIKAKIAQIEARGSTDIDAGLRAGYDMFLRKQAPAGYQRRVLLMTDAQPNTGNTDPNGFEALVARYGQAGIGMTAFGIGMDFGAELAEKIGNQRGGNYVYLSGPADVEKVFREDFDYLMTPAAYDMALTVKPAQGFELTDAYGVGAFKAVDGGYELKVKSLFFSKNRGAIMLRLEETTPGAGGTGAAVVAKGTLKYLRADAKTEVNETIEAAATGDRPAGEGLYFAPANIRKAVALTNEFLGLRAALKLHQEGKRADAQAILAKVQAELEAAKQALATTDLDLEIKMITQLSANMGTQGAGATPAPSKTPSAASPDVSPTPTPTATSPAS
jgi:Ca-activated chloride channel family protein